MGAFITRHLLQLVASMVLGPCGYTEYNPSMSMEHSMYTTTLTPVPLPIPYLPISLSVYNPTYLLIKTSNFCLSTRSYVAMLSSL